MGGQEIALPVNAYNVRLVKDNIEYPVDIDTDGFTRISDDGTIKILTLFDGTEFEEEILDGCWKKGWSTGMDSNQAFTAIVDITDAILELQGEADVAGTSGYGWINGNQPIPLLDELEIEFALQVPVDDTGGTASRDIFLRFYLKQDKNETNPTSDDNYIFIGITVDENGLLLQLYKECSGVQTKIGDGYNYELDTSRSTGDLEAIVVRLVFDGKPGTTGAQMYAYIRQNDTLENAELEEEIEFTGSPFDISDLQFSVAYPSILIISQNTTYFDEDNEAKVAYIKTSYPYFEVKYNTPDDDILTTQVKIWDGDPDSGGVQVFDVDHVFSNEMYFTNGLLKGTLQGDGLNGLYLWYWNPNNPNYTQGTMQGYFNLDTDGVYCYYAHLVKLISISPKECVFKVIWTDTTTVDHDYYVKADVTVSFGKLYVKIEPTDVYPNQDFFMQSYILGSRFAYLGKDMNYLPDDELALSGQNATMNDNFMLAFDVDSRPFIMLLATNKKPDGSTSRYYSFRGDMIRFEQWSKPQDLLILFGLIYFENTDNLFYEAEDMTHSGSAREYSDNNTESCASPDDTDALTEALNDAGYEDAFDITATAFNNGAGDYDSVQSNEGSIVVCGNQAQRSDITDVGGGGALDVGLDFDLGVGNGIDVSSYDYLGFMIYGEVDLVDIAVNISDDSGPSWGTKQTFTIPSGEGEEWHWVVFKRTDFTAAGLDFTDIRRMVIYADDCGDEQFFIVDKPIWFNGLWSDPYANTTLIENDTDENSVGKYCLSMESQGAGNAGAEITPISAIANLLKFDYVKLYAHKNGSGSTTLYLYLYDGDGDWIRYDLVITTSATQYSIELPHQTSDLAGLGWTESGAGDFDFDDFTKYRFRWSAAGAGEIRYIDGLHFYIDTTTTKDRGETVSGTGMAVLYSQWENIRVVLNPVGDELPEGRYLFMARAMDTDQVADDLGLDLQNITDSSYRNENNSLKLNTLTAVMANYYEVFDISGTDVDDGDQVNLMVQKRYSTENTIFVDSILAIPVGDGMSLPQDLAHNGMRIATIKRRVRRK